MIKLGIGVVSFAFLFGIDALQQFPDRGTLKGQVDKYCKGLNYDIGTYGTIDEWDVSMVTDMRHLFQYYTDCDPNISAWDVGGVTSFHYMFASNTKFNQNISTWNVSSGEDFSFMFQSSIFNQDISGWDVSSSFSFNMMFNRNSEFNQDISGWDVSSGLMFEYMFYDATSFNNDISEWDISSVTTFMGMFSGATEFNQDLSKWDVSSVTNMNSVFYETKFNQDISGWDVSSVENFRGMFVRVNEFNQDISGWDVSSGEDFREMFQGASSFRQDLSSWPQIAKDASYFCAGAKCNYVAPPTTHIPTKSPVSRDPTSEPTVVALENLWKIVPGSTTYDNLKFSFNYKIHRHHSESILRALVLDKECTNPTNPDNTDVSSAFATNVLLISTENALVEVNLNTSEILDLGSNYFEYKDDGDAGIYFCLRFGIFDDGVEVNFVESIAQLDVSLTDKNFTVTGATVSPKERDASNETDAFTVTVKFCDSAGNLISDVVLNQGQSIKVCVSVDDQTTIIDKVFDFSWRKDENGEYEQVALDNDGNAEKFSSLSCTGLSGECSFESLLTAQFYTSTSTVTGRGSALLKFDTGRRVMSRILLSRSVQNTGGETAGIATMSTPPLTTASFNHKGIFLSGGFSYGPFKPMMASMLASSLLLIL